MGNKRQVWVYILLAVGWITIVVWQWIEHKRTGEDRRDALLQRSATMSRALGAIIRPGTQMPMSFISRDWIEAALKDLTQSQEIISISLLNLDGAIVASAGTPPFENLGNLRADETLWGPNTLAVVNAVEIGQTQVSPDFATSRTTIVVDPYPVGPPPGQDDEKTTGSQRRRRGRSDDDGTSASEFDGRRARGPDGPPPGFRPPEGGGPPPPAYSGAEGEKRFERSDRDEPRPGWRRGPGRSRSREEQEKFERFIEKMTRERTLHRFVIFMSTEMLDREIEADLHMRLIICAFTLLASVGLGSAWRGVERSTELQLRLVRARQANVYLREKNVAAAGLAHETRNPLNIIRGLAQMISKSPEAGETIRKKSTELIEEVDRVTSRLNEFIDYSKPREPKPTPTDLVALVRDVERMLESDFEDKRVRFSAQMPSLTIQADEALLRQVLFNLLINAAQAVSAEGQIEVFATADRDGRVTLDVRDDGPGVPPENREEIFRPYFTTSAQGTGLGLAVVWQICLAHDWEIAYVDSERGGATFRISGMKLAGTV